MMPPMKKPARISNPLLLTIGAADPVCRFPMALVGVLSLPSVAPGVTTSTCVIVVTAPPGSVDLNVEVFDVGVGVVDVVDVKAIQG